MTKRPEIPSASSSRISWFGLVMFTVLFVLVMAALIKGMFGL